MTSHQPLFRRKYEWPRIRFYNSKHLINIKLLNNGERLFIYNVIGRRPAGGGESRLRLLSREVKILCAPDIAGGSSRLGKKAGRSEVLTGVLRSDGEWPSAGAGTGFSAQSKPSAPMSASESKCGPVGWSASVPIPSGTTCSSAHDPYDITNNASVKTCSRAAVRRGLAPRDPAPQFYQWSIGPIFGSGARISANRAASCPPQGWRHRPTPPTARAAPTTPRLARAVLFRPSRQPQSLREPSMRSCRVCSIYSSLHWLLCCVWTLNCALLQDLSVQSKQFINITLFYTLLVRFYSSFFYLIWLLSRDLLENVLFVSMFKC